ncbi:hypothetical protein X975_18260, partial [Stegodyphus mimosarum]
MRRHALQLQFRMGLFETKELFHLQHSFPKRYTERKTAYDFAFLELKKYALEYVSILTS